MHPDLTDLTEHQHHAAHRSIAREYLQPSPQELTNALDAQPVERGKVTNFELNGAIPGFTVSRQLFRNFPDIPDTSVRGYVPNAHDSSL